MILGALLIAYLARTIAHPLQSAPDNPDPDPGPTSLSALSSINPIAIGAVACIQNPANVRTLWNIVSGCLTTIGLCTWASIHPNIPDQHASWLAKKTGRVMITICALLAPECVIVWAMRQWIVAGKVEKKYRDHRWTKAHGFFIQMGGFILEDQGTFKSLVVNEEGLACIAAHDPRETPELYKGVLPAIREEEINDKAKGDWLTKMFVSLQTIWFVLRCIVRWAEGLAVTELEVVTLAFAVLNCFTYILWWSKPMNAGYPVYFKANGERSYGPRVECKENWVLSEMYHVGTEEWEAWLCRGVVSIYGDILMESVFTQLRQMPRKAAILACAGLFPMGFKSLHHALHYTDLHTYFSGELTFRENFVLGCGFSLVGALFGGIHMAGWNFDFPSERERMLWRVSSIIVTVVPLFVALTAPLSQIFLRKVAALEYLMGDWPTGWRLLTENGRPSITQILMIVAFQTVIIFAYATSLLQHIKR
ncbi:hypothetical protein AX16_010216 [Volvariella volvacea WC 439]|nr:hypothetical protein AX16_010216 [Volvariella volvacea WC 439]